MTKLKTDNVSQIARLIRVDVFDLVWPKVDLVTTPELRAHVRDGVTGLYVFPTVMLRDIDAYEDY